MDKYQERIKDEWNVVMWKRNDSCGGVYRVGEWYEKKWDVGVG